MEFCKDCGGVLNLFGNHSSELCSSCVQHAKSVPVPPTPKSPQVESTDILLDAVISYADGKIFLHSKEGWQLWSGSATRQTPMAEILKAARLIYKIRSKRKKKN